ncbi:patatin-like phospholipase family protein [Clostridium taeniosporum]|uniref:Patatin family protein n=1 Tax=Clostridium taeniosporum TaxID=394958 RepID=A0A1D7XHG9_9CLOT|nr:patatin family protein [Clostridium taeniosporum]AOR22509.1 patatin family protein [Clostridium taeniosporum]
MTGLVLEGGAFRGLFTAGVLDALLDMNLDMKYIVGVSAGITNGYSYVSRQRGRNLEVMEKFINHKRYVGYRNLLKCKSIMDMDFVFDEIPNEHCPFDYETFDKFDGKVLAGSVNVNTGEVEYFDKKHIENQNTILRATCSIPLLFQFVEIKNQFYADGGLIDAIPIKKSVFDGNNKNIIVLTRNEGYRKHESKVSKFVYKLYRKRYPKLAEALKNRHIQYNNQLDYCKELENKNEAIIIRPTIEMNIGRFERDKNKLKEIYNNGYNETIKIREKLIKFID